MKTFRAKENFTITHEGFPRHIIANTDYEIVDTNQGIGFYIKVYEPGNTNETFNAYLSPKEITLYGIELSELTLKDVNDILNEVTMAPSCVDFKWGWEVTEVRGDCTLDGKWSASINKISGFLINTFFTRPDTNTGEMGIGRGRRMWIESTASRTSIVMTAYVCIDLIVRHETLEAFLFQNAKILNPHKTVEQLAYPEVLKPAEKEHVR